MTDKEYMEKIIECFDVSSLYDDEEIENIIKQIRADVIEETHKLICDYLYSNNIHLIKISKDEADTPIYPYKVADDIYKQLKEQK